MEKNNQNRENKAHTHKIMNIGNEARYFFCFSLHSTEKELCDKEKKIRTHTQNKNNKNSYIYGFTVVSNLVDNRKK